MGIKIDIAVMIKYKAGYKYQLTEDYQVFVPIFKDVRTDFLELKKGILTIKKGYAWDGPSGPVKAIAEILEKIPLIGKWLYRKYLKSFMRGSLVHDALYQLMRYGLLDQSYREAADWTLREICLEDGMGKTRAWWVYHGVRKAAGFAADPDNKTPVLTAP